MTLQSNLSSEISTSQSDTNSSEASIKIINVEQLNVQIRSLIEGQIGLVWVKAEISNFKPHSSGHFYFSLKDAKSQISAIMFRGHNSKLKFKPHDGLEVIVRGRVTVYEPRGSYQIACEFMEPVGAGALQKEFEQLKNKLRLEGLFDPERKKMIPPHPQKVAIVTSPTGAAIQDILNIMKRRAPAVEVFVVPTLVQGASAAPLIIDAFLNAQKIKPDVIIIARGGGSIEDMWCFNNENLARAIAACEIPVISAIGHEIDFTICDFVADLRAPTPSAAAELVAKNANEVLQKVSQLNRSLMLLIKNKIELQIKGVHYLTQRLVDPKRKLQDLNFKNDELLNRLELACSTRLSHFKKDIELYRRRLISPEQVIAKSKMNVDQKMIRMQNQMQTNLKQLQYRLTTGMSLLDSLSPMKVVDRGFSIVKKDQDLVASIKKIKIKDQINIQFKDGSAVAEIIKIN